MNKYFVRSAKSFNRKVDSHDDTFDGTYTYRFKQMLRLIILPKHGKILGIACGNVKFLHMLSQLKLIEGYGVDPSEKMAENTQLLNSSMVIMRVACVSLDVYMCE